MGNLLEVSGLWDDQTVAAGQILKLPAVQDKIVIRGIVRLINEPNISINNVLIDTDLIPDDGFFLAEEVPALRTQFIDQVLEDDWVESSGELLPGDSVVRDSIGLAQTD